MLSKVNEIHVEVTEYCNLRCEYCYFIEKKKIIKKRNPEIFIDIIRKVLLESSEKKIKLIFHGGEPLLYNAEWFESVCKAIKNDQEKFKRTITFNIQTNGTLLNEHHLAYFNKYRFVVNVSLDGTKEIHNLGRGCYGKTVQSIARLQDNNLLGSIIVVISKHNFDKIFSIVNHLVDLNIRKYHFNIASIVGKNKYLVLNKDEILEFYLTSFESFRVHYSKACNWLLLSKLRRFVENIHDFKLACDSPICHAGVNMILIRPNGDFYPCGSCVSNADSIERFKMGNVNNLSYTNDYENKLITFHKNYFDNKTKCDSCGASIICDFSCPAFDCYDPQTAENRCKATRLFYKYLLKQNIKEIETMVSYFN